ncbi:hypothetical protein EON65_30705 [archaeon]|nr:MAG: hypothetical protein EON65_30705 [archaeon]
MEGQSQVLTVGESLEHDEVESFAGNSYVPPEAPLPSISPRDRLSYQDDKKTYKELNKYLKSNTDLYLLIQLMEEEILKNKPDDIVKFLAEDFFTERKQLALRKMMGSGKSKK